MEFIFNIPAKIDVKYLKIDAGVRYWEDGELNGVCDEEDGCPMMPFAQESETKGEYRWRPTIDIETGKVVGWPKDVTASVHYKVCDDGKYSLYTEDNTLIVETEDNCYVLECIGEYGDYIVMNIDGEGLIEDWHFSQADVDEIMENANLEDLA